MIDVKHKLVFKFPKHQPAMLLGILEIGLLVFYNLIGLDYFKVIINGT